MNDFICDYECRTVGESLVKYNIPDDWCAEFDVYDGIYPIFCVRIDQIRIVPDMMDLKLRIVENPDEEYAGCMVLPDQKTIAFKIQSFSDLMASEREQGKKE